MSKHAAPDSEKGFYAHAIRLFHEAGIPFLVGGAYALREYTGIIRDTKDFDVFIRPDDVARALEAFHRAHYRAEVTFSHWLAKAHYGENFIDIIFRAGNGLCGVDDLWFRGNEGTVLLGESARLVPVEEMIWQKAYIMERERYDGADVAHLLQARAEKINWDHLLARFGEDWRVLFAHLVLFGFIYPAERDRIPTVVMQDLQRRMDEKPTPAAARSANPICQGTLISRAQFLPDIERWEYVDARIQRSDMTPEQIERWTDAIGQERAWV